MDSATRADMEARFDHDFGNVRLHSGPKAAESARGRRGLDIHQDKIFKAGDISDHGNS
jgi:hypothetical protein